MQNNRDPKDYAKCMGTKTIKKGDVVLAYVCKNSVLFTPRGTEEWSLDERQMIADSAEDA